MAKMTKKEQREAEKAKQEEISGLLKEWKEAREASKVEEQQIKDRMGRLTAKMVRTSELRQRCNELAQKVYELTKDDDGKSQPAGQGSDGTIYTAHPKDVTYGVIDDHGDLVMSQLLDDEDYPMIDADGEPVLAPKSETITVYQVRTHIPQQAGRKLSL